MIRNGILFVFLAFSLLGTRVDAQPRYADCDLSCVFEAIWWEIEVLQDDDRSRLEPGFLQMVAHSEDDALIEKWEQQLGRAARTAEPYNDYARAKVETFVETYGWKAFFERSELKQRPFNSGRPEMMAAAAEYLADDETAQRIYDLMERLAKADRSEAAFERASFGHVLAEAAMRRCDVSAFERALRLTDAPDALRYAAWRTRMTGKMSDVLARLESMHEGSRAMHIRQVTDGFADILALNSCGRSDKKQGGVNEVADSDNVPF